MTEFQNGLQMGTSGVTGDCHFRSVGAWGEIPLVARRDQSSYSDTGTIRRLAPLDLK